MSYWTVPLLIYFKARELISKYSAHLINEIFNFLVAVGKKTIPRYFRIRIGNIE